MSDIVLYAPEALRPFTGPTTVSVLIVDGSQSMIRFGGAPRNAVNDHITTLKDRRDGRHYLCGVATFAGTPKIQIPLAPVRMIPGLGPYRNEPGTLLWKTTDIILGQMLERMPIAHDLRVVVGVFSDGDDRRSDRSVYPEKLQETSREARMRGWELMTYGFGIDAKRIARQMGFPDDDDHTFCAEAKEEDIHTAMHDMTMTTTIGGGRAWRIKTTI